MGLCPLVCLCHRISGGGGGRPGTRGPGSFHWRRTLRGHHGWRLCYPLASWGKWSHSGAFGFACPDCYCWMVKLEITRSGSWISIQHPIDFLDFLTTQIFGFEQEKILVTGRRDVCRILGSRDGQTSANSHHTGVWSEGLSLARGPLSIPEPIKRSAAWGESRKWSIRRPWS